MSTAMNRADGGPRREVEREGLRGGLVSPYNQSSDAPSSHDWRRWLHVVMTAARATPRVLGEAMWKNESPEQCKFKPRDKDKYAAHPA